MASTSNKNTASDYCLQQRSYTDSLKYTEYEYSQSGRAYVNAIPCVGITPSHMPREAFSNNSVEIESALFGINSSNLVNPQAPVKPSLKQLPERSFFNRMPMYMPEPMVIEKNQRPFPIPN
jgi:hypothetical protein